MKLPVSAVFALLALVAPLVPARADDAAALLAQLNQLLAQAGGSHAVTPAQTAQVQALLQQNQPSLQNLLSLLQSDSAAPAPATAPALQTAAAPPAPAPTHQQSARLQTGALQASGGLSAAHLASYPALPDVSPTSSIPNPTAAQLAQGAALDHQVQIRKRELSARVQ